MKNAAGGHHLTAVTTDKWVLGMRHVFPRSHMTVLMTVARAIRRGLQLLVLIRCEEGEDLLVRSLVLFFPFGATSRLRRG